MAHPTHRRFLFVGCFVRCMPLVLTTAVKLARLSSRWQSRKTLGRHDLVVSSPRPALVRSIRSGRCDHLPDLFDLILQILRSVIDPWMERKSIRIFL